MLFRSGSTQRGVYAKGCLRREGYCAERGQLRVGLGRRGSTQRGVHAEGGLHREGFMQKGRGVLDILVALAPGDVLVLLGRGASHAEYFRSLVPGFLEQCD